MGSIARLVIFLAVIYGAYSYARRVLASGAAPRPPQPRPQAKLIVQDLTLCGVCGTYLSPQSGGCGKAQCPRGAPRPS